MKQLLVVGGASYDVIHLEDQTVSCAGGGGTYTAMSARRCGVGVTLFAPRPEPCPEYLVPVAGRLVDWLGPAVTPDQLAHFEISHRGGETDYLQSSFGAEADLSPMLLPDDLSQYDLIHLIPLGDAGRQLAFIEACRQRGARRISAGTGLPIAAGQPRAVRAVLDQVDYFFMNDREARFVFGSLEAAVARPGKILYITLGAQGAYVYQGDTRTLIPAVSAAERDPTGAGDAFCGATLAYLLQNHHPIMAARRAASLAAEMIGQVGPAALLLDDRPPDIPHDPRVRLNDGQLRRVAGEVATLPEATPFPFVSPVLPPVGHPKALDYFFAATAQQFSFWTIRDGRYHRPVLAQIGGTQRKGSDYFWDAFRRQVEVDPGFCSPERLANLSREELMAVLRADDGHDPMTAVDLHLEKAHQYGRDMLALQLTPQSILQEAQAADQPLQTLLAILDQITGYKEDPLRKKSSLLALILDQRPERFLPLGKDEQVAPVIDYHVMRTCLRVGLIDVLDEALAAKLVARQIVAPDEEWAVRFAAYRAMERLVDLSGVSLGAVDALFFNARRYCPEMSEPECRACQLDPVCAHRKNLFQPVLRTTFY